MNRDGDTVTDRNDSRPPLPSVVIMLGWVSLLADVSSEMVYPIIPLFVVGALGASRTMLGWIEGAAVLIVAVATIWSGMHSDVGRRRLPYVRVGYSLPVVGKALLVVATGWPWVLTGRLVDRLGKGLRSSPRDALIASAVDRPDRGRAFGFHRAMDTTGALLGVLLSAAILWWFTGSPAAMDGSSRPPDAAWPLRIAFAVAAILGLLAAGLTFLLSESAASSRADRLAPRESAATYQLSPAYWRALALMLVFSIANSSDVFLLLRARELGMPDWLVVLGYALYNATYAALAYPAGRVSDRLGPWRVMAVGWLIYAFVYAGMVFSGRAGLWLLLALYGVYMALTDGVSRALVVNLAPADRRATALAVFQVATGVVALGSSVAAGFLWDRFGHEVTFATGSIAAIVAVVLLIAVRPMAS